MKKLKLIVITLLIFATYGNLIGDDITILNSDVNYEPVITLEEFELIITHNIDYALNTFDSDMEKKIFTGQVVCFLARQIMINPEVNIKRINEVIKVAENKFYNSGTTDKFIDKSYEAEYYVTLCEIEVLKRNYSKALELMLKGIKCNETYLLSKDVEKKWGISYVNNIKSSIIDSKIVYNIIYALKMKEMNKPIDKDNKELFKLGDNIEFYNNPDAFKMYLSMLLIYNQTEKFKKAVIENISKEKNEALLFKCTEVAESYFKYYFSHKYWLNKSSTAAIEEMKQYVMPKVGKCDPYKFWLNVK